MKQIPSRMRAFAKLLTWIQLFFIIVSIVEWDWRLAVFPIIAIAIIKIIMWLHFTREFLKAVKCGEFTEDDFIDTIGKPMIKK